MLNKTTNQNQISQPGGIRVKSGTKAGGYNSNHNQILSVRAGLKAGTIILEQ
jgi:hypothetical protein